MCQVLIVEDSKTQRTIIEDLLIDNGLSVLLASNGIEALQCLEKSSPDLVVLDVVMPKMNGYELCRHIKQNPRTKNIPVVMCSSKKEDFDRYWGMKQGADAYVIKPFQKKEFVGTVKQLLKSYIYMYNKGVEKGKCC